MADRTYITFVVAVNNREVLENNFLASPCLQAPHEHQILVQENFPAAAKAYNDAIGKSVNDLIVFCHQDILLPSSWMGQLEQALLCLEKKDPLWGVLGCYGRTADGRGRKGWGHVYSPGRGIVGEPLEHPVPVQTLDELALILRKSSGLRFDENLPHFHFYGTDICLTAATRGMKCYSIPAWCIHNTQLYLTYPREFYECYRHIRRKWRKHLPIQTSCVRITRLGLPVHKLRLREIYLRCSGRQVPVTRVRDGRRVLLEVEAGNPGTGNGAIQVIDSCPP